MRIALVKRRYSLRHGGSERYCVNMARWLQADGHDVTVIGESIDAQLAGEVEFVRVPVNRLTSWTSSRSFAENSGRAVARGGYDIAYGLGRAYGLDAVRVTERLQVHWVNVRYRNRLFRRLQGWNPRHRTLIGLEKSIYRNEQVRRVVTQSQLDRRLVVEHYRVPVEKIRTIYNGVDTETFHPRVKSGSAEVRAELAVAAGRPLLLFASMDFAGKGLRSILQALARLRDHDAQLLVLGNGPVRRFQRIARDLGVGQRVIFAGRKGEIQRYYGAGDLFLLPTAYEPFPNVNLEAMACGTPVLTTRTSGGADIVCEGQNGYLIDSIDAVAQIAEGVDRHLSLTSSRRADMARHCRRTAEGLTIEKNMQQTLEVFNEVLREKFRV